MNNKDAPLTPISQEIIKVWGPLCQEKGTKTKYLYFLLYHNITKSKLNPK